MSDHDRLAQLLELGDRPIEFPPAERAALREAILATANHPSVHEARTALMLRPPIEQPPARRSRSWLIGAVAACVVVVVALAIVFSRPDSGPGTVATAPSDDQATIAELCDQVRALAPANGLIGAGAPSDAGELDELADILDELAARTGGDPTNLADLATRVRLLALAVAEGRGAVAINTVRAIDDDVINLLTGEAMCGE